MKPIEVKDIKPGHLIKDPRETRSEFWFEVAAKATMHSSSASDQNNGKEVIFGFSIYNFRGEIWKEPGWAWANENKWVVMESAFKGVEGSE